MSAYDDITEGLKKIHDSVYVSGTKRTSSYKSGHTKDGEYPRVKAYLDGGAAPSPWPTTLMGQGLSLVERGRRALAPEPPPPPPPPQTLPATITTGGTYTGTRTGMVQVRTTEPVLILDSIISNPSSSDCINVDYAGAQVTVRGCTLTGAPGYDGKAVGGSNVKSLLVENCDITYTWGIRVDAVQNGGSFIVRRCKVRNIQRYKSNPSGLSHFFQTAFNGGSVFTCECAWNEVINIWGEGQGSDLVSIHSTQSATTPLIHDNFLYGSYVDQSDTNPAGGHSGSAIMLEYANNCQVYGNVCVATTNCGIGMADGANNKIHDNRCVSSGKTPSGQQFGGANVGIYCNQGQGGNEVRNNHIGWMGYPGGNFGRNDAYLPLDGGSWYDDNSYFPSGAITKAQEDAEHTAWLAKVAAAGIHIGV